MMASSRCSIAPSPRPRAARANSRAEFHEREILAAGGGAFIDPETRTLIRDYGVSVWLRADLDTLAARTKGRNHRPLLNAGEPRDILAKLIEERYPVYAEANIVVDTGADNPNVTCARVVEALTHIAGTEIASAPAESAP